MDHFEIKYGSLKIMTIKAECTWGEGPDVLLTVERGNEKARWYDLTSQEARILSNQLIVSARYAEEMDMSIIQYSETHKR